MKKAYFRAVCPFEIGDILRTPNGAAEITDIAAIHYVKSGDVDFQYELNHSGRYIPLRDMKIDRVFAECSKK